MIEKLITLSVRWPYRVIAAVVFLCGLTLAELSRLSLDALPEITEPQVIVEIVWEAPTERIDREVAEPVSRALMTIPGIQRVRTSCEMSYGFVYAILADGADPQTTRHDILFRLANLSPSLPPGARVRVGPDASSVGWIYQYAISDPGGHRDLRELYDIQTRLIAPLLAEAPGVEEVATVGGLTRQIQIQVYPALLAHYRLPLGSVLDSVRDALADAGGRMVEISGRDFQIRAVAPFQKLDDLEEAYVGKDAKGLPIRIRDIGFVQIGFDLRRGIAELNGRGEVVGGIVVMRQGENALRVLTGVKKKIEEAKMNLPVGTEWTTVYDRSDLIHESISKMGWTLGEEMMAVALVCLLFLLHLRSALVPILILPVVCLIPFLFMRLFHVPVHLPVLAGIAIALGEIVDAVLVMVENAHRKLSEGREETELIMTGALVQVGRPLFYSLAIILFSFLPVFLLEAQEGRLFRPLALAKTFAMLASVFLSITLGPALIRLLLKGQISPEEKNPVSRGLHAVYAPTLQWAMRHKAVVVGVNILLLLIIPYAWRLDKSFMPPLEEGTILYMPSTLPGLPIREAGWILQKQDALLREVPEVATVFGKAGRAQTPTDPAPLSMIETTITLKPKSAWRRGQTLDRLIADMDRRMQFPGWINAWTQPIRGRMDMLATGIRTEVGVILYGDNLAEMEKSAEMAESLLTSIPGVRNVYAERQTQGYFMDAQFDRSALGRAGITEREASDYLRVAMSGAEVARFRGAAWDTGPLSRLSDPVTVLFVKEDADEIQKIEELPVVLPGGNSIPFSSIGKISLKTAPAAIRREQGRWAGYIHADVVPSRSGKVVEEAKSLFASSLPRTVQAEFVGQFQYRERAARRLGIAIPIVLIIIFFLLRYTFHSTTEALILMLSVPAAMAGGILSQAMAGYPTTVAVLVGYIALYAVAVQTGVVMVVYLKEAYERKCEEAGPSLSETQLEEAVFAGAVLRLRPKLMTVATTVLGFVPILWAAGPGAEMLRHITVPMIGGMVTSTIHVLYLTPILFLWLHRRKTRT